MGSKYTPAQKAAIEKYQNKFCDIQVRVPPELKEALKQAAADSGKSLNQFMTDSAIEQMKKGVQ